MAPLKQAKLLFCLALVTFVSYVPALKNDFVDLDDRSYVTQNPDILELSWKQAAHIFTSFHYGLYKPMVLISYAIEHHFFGLNAPGYHLTNIVLHVLNTLAVFWLIYLISKENILVSLLTAVLFGVHPVHVESVAWVTERKDVLYSFFYLGGLVSYIYFLRTKKIVFRVLALVSLVFSLSSKPMAVTFPLILLLLDVWYGRKFSKEILWEKAPFFVLAGVFAGVNFGLAHALGEVHSISVTGDTARFLKTISYNPLFYIYKIFVPTKLSCIYPHPDRLGWLGQSLFHQSPVILIAFLAAMYLWARRSSFVWFGLVFFGISLLPVMQIFPFGAAIVADRYTYLSSIGIFFIFSEVIFRAARGRRSIYAAVVLMVALLSVLTWNQCKVWTNSLTLWDHVIRHYPMIPMSYCNRGNEYVALGEETKALEDYNRALALKPDYADVYNNRGSLFEKKALHALAAADFKQALKFKPSHELAYPNFEKNKISMERKLILYSELIAAHPEEAENYFLRGNIYADYRMSGKAMEDYNRALELKPDWAEVYNNRGILFFDTGQWEAARADFKKAEELDQNFEEAHLNLTLVLKKLNKKVRPAGVEPAT